MIAVALSATGTLASTWVSVNLSSGTLGPAMTVASISGAWPRFLGSVCGFAVRVTVCASAVPPRSATAIAVVASVRRFMTGT
ncbi:MAG: hypothetical protein R2939_19095 [Kofleriaceae bacterium]